MLSDCTLLKSPGRAGGVGLGSGRQGQGRTLQQIQAKLNRIFAGRMS